MPKSARHIAKTGIGGIRPTQSKDPRWRVRGYGTAVLLTVHLSAVNFDKAVASACVFAFSDCRFASCQQRRETQDKSSFCCALSLAPPLRSILCRTNTGRVILFGPSHGMRPSGCWAPWLPGGAHIRDRPLTPGRALLQRRGRGTSELTDHILTS
jgi:hypothetical protein